MEAGRGRGSRRKLMCKEISENLTRQRRRVKKTAGSLTSRAPAAHSRAEIRSTVFFISRGVLSLKEGRFATALRRFQSAYPCWSRPPVLPIVGVSCVVGQGYDNHSLITNDERDVVGETGQVDPTPAAFPQPSKQRVLNHRRAGILQLVTKSRAESGNLGLVIARDALGLRLGLGRKLKHEVHRSGAISRSLRNTSTAGTVLVCPESKAEMQREISPDQASFAEAALSVSTLSIKASARLMRCSAGRTKT